MKPCPNCGCRDLKIDGFQQVEDFITINEDGEFDIYDTKFYDTDWPDDAYTECVDCCHKMKTGKWPH